MTEPPFNPDTGEKNWVETPGQVLCAQGSHANWVSVKDRLPEDGRSVLLAFPSGFMCVGRKMRHGEWHNGQGEVRDVTHWMPLPEPPKETH